MIYTNIWFWLVLYLILINVITFGIYGIDKRKAIHNRYRISEATLLWLAFVGGSVGAFLGMRMFHHKTKKAKFKISVPFMIVIHIAIIVFAIIELR